MLGILLKLNGNNLFNPFLYFRDESDEIEFVSPWDLEYENHPFSLEYISGNMCTLLYYLFQKMILKIAKNFLS